MSVFVLYTVDEFGLWLCGSTHQVVRGAVWER